MHLVLVGKELDKAEVYAKKALELNHDSAEFIYAYAKVFYAKKKFSKALNWVEKGLVISPNDLPLNHLKGKILKQIDEKTIK